MMSDRICTINAKFLVQIKFNSENCFAFCFDFEASIRFSADLLNSETLKTFRNRHLFKVLEAKMGELNIDISMVFDLKEAISSKNFKWFLIIFKSEANRNYFMFIFDTHIYQHLLIWVHSSVQLRKVVFNKGRSIDVMVFFKRNISYLKLRFNKF